MARGAGCGVDQPGARPAGSASRPGRPPARGESSSYYRGHYHHNPYRSLCERYSERCGCNDNAPSGRPAPRGSPAGAARRRRPAVWTTARHHSAPAMMRCPHRGAPYSPRERGRAILGRGLHGCMAEGPRPRRPPRRPPPPARPPAPWPRAARRRPRRACARRPPPPPGIRTVQPTPGIRTPRDPLQPCATRRPGAPAARPPPRPRRPRPRRAAAGPPRRTRR